MSDKTHDKIIKMAANENLAPIGMFQKGQSRCWLDDNGWFLIQVEFQPSSWSKGAYLNVGISFLWDKTEALNETLSFDVGYREKEHVEFKGDEEEFYKEMVGMAVYARDKVILFRQYNDFDFCKQKLKEFADERNSLWCNWDMAMFCFLTKDNGNGKKYIRRIVENNNQETTGIDWIDKMTIKSKELLMAEDDLACFVLNTIHERRRNFSNKSSFKKLKNWQGIYPRS